MRFLPAGDREALQGLVEGLRSVCEMGSFSSGSADGCISILTLRDSLTRAQSTAWDSEIDEGVRILQGGGSSNLSVFERNETVRKVLEWGESFAIGSDPAKSLLLSELAHGRDKSFLSDVMAKSSFLDDTSSYTGSCGYSVGSTAYISHIEQHIFDGWSPDGFLAPVSRRAYADMLRLSLGNIATTISQDIDRGKQQNDYVKDENAANLVRAVGELERCGVRSGATAEEIRQLAWFVGGNEADIRKLQQKLNELGVAGGSLAVDGVYGKETAKAWGEFLNKLEHGVVPTLGWIDPLQSGITNLELSFKTIKSGEQFARIVQSGTGFPVARLDLHPYNGNPTFYHINSQAPKGASQLQQQVVAGIDHMPISKNAYDILKNFDKSAKTIRVAGRVLLVAGIVSDTLAIGMTIDADLKDADKKIGKKTYSQVAGSIGSWGGAWAGAKLGAMAGASAGTAVAPGLGTVIGGAVLGVVGGIAGAFGGDALMRWIVDITVVGE